MLYGALSYEVSVNLRVWLTENTNLYSENVDLLILDLDFVQQSAFLSCEGLSNKDISK